MKAKPKTVGQWCKTTSTKLSATMALDLLVWLKEEKDKLVQ
jgi:hypothetical protein